MTISRRDGRFAVAVLLAILAAAILAFANVTKTDAACSDPISANDLFVYRSLSGVEADWHVTVADGCEASLKLVIYRPDRDPDDPRSMIHYTSGPITVGPGSYTLNAGISTGRVVDAVLTADGRIYGIERFDPVAVP